tara:strand:- start:59672 stop:60292 length:621 start_codon:yes stop_codon:yes gene_type:complete
MMALEVSVVASAQRLQAQQDRQAQLRQERQATEATAQLRQQERVRAERLRAQEDAREAARSQTSREIVRAAVDNRSFDDQRVRDNLDQRTENRNARLATDSQEALDDARFSAQQRDDSLAAAALSSVAAPLTSAPTPDNSTSQDTLRQLLAERNSRLNKRDAAQRQFAAQQQQDLSRAQSSIEALRSDPSSFPATPTRGEVVDVQA